MCAASAAPAPNQKGSPEARTQTGSPAHAKSFGIVSRNGFSHSSISADTPFTIERCRTPPTIRAALSMSRFAAGERPSRLLSPMPTMDSHRRCVPLLFTMTSPAPFSAARAMRILLLGGSTEASALASALATDPRFEAILSLAGRTRQPRLQPVPVRTGGFGGVDGLASFLLENGIDLVIDATHPFASQMSGNAIKAGKITGTPLLAIERPAWVQRDADNGIEAPTVASAVQAIGPDARNVFCAIGSLALANLECAPHHTYLIRVIDKPASPPKLPNIHDLQSTG